MMRITLAIAALLSPFMVPLPLSLLFIAWAAFLAPFVAAAAGLLIDLAYAPGMFGFSTLVGVLGTMVMLFVRRFTQTRIMGG